MQKTHYKNNLLLIISLFGLITLLFPVTTTKAAVLTVTNLNDAGAGSFRDAITNAVGGDVIEFAVTGTITLTTNITITEDITINGNGANALTLTSNNDASPVLQIGAGAVVSVNNLTIADSTNLTGGVGGGIINDGNLTLQTVTMRNNYAIDGGAIFNAGSIFVYDSIFDGNSTISAGAVILSYAFGGTAEFHRTTMSGNFGPNIIANDADSPMLITDSSIVNNNSSFRLIEHQNNTMTLNYNIIAGNLGITTYNVSGIPIDATCNYWGADDGPSGEGTGSGDIVGTETTYIPFRPSVACGDDPDNPQEIFVPSFASVDPLNSQEAGTDLYEAQGMPDNTYSRILMQNGRWMVGEQTLPQNLIDAGVIMAMDIYTVNGSLISNDLGGYNLICARGQGRMIFLDATTSPRAQYEITDAYFDDLGNTCGWIPNGGTVVLIESE